MNTILHVHREIKQVDNFKVGEIYKNYRIESFYTLKGSIRIRLHKINKDGSYDFRSKVFSVNMNKPFVL